MSRRRYALCSSILAALLANACSPAADSPSSGNDSDANTSVTTDSGFTFETEPVDGGSAKDSASEDAAPIDSTPACTPSGGADDPDDDFKDTNCDGIDGDKAHAVFVAPTGSDEAAGTMDAPVKTIAKAIERATEGGKDVYACNGTYAESIVVTKAVRVFGGYDCKSGWKRTLDRASISPSKGIPLTVLSVTGAGLRIDRITLHAPDGVEPGESSIALLASDSQVVVTNGSLQAGAGADGYSPPASAAVTTAATKGANATSIGAKSCPTNLSLAPWTLVWLCTNPQQGAQTTTAVTECEGHGGAGGNGAVWSRDTTKAVAPTAGAAGLVAPAGAPARSTMGAGLDGTPGTVGLLGSPSTKGFGTLSDKGYVATNNGLPGAPGANGGGGSGGWGNYGGPTSTGDFPEYYFNGGAGGEGGFGGCGGAGGAAGSGGGASFAVVSWKSTISLSKTTVDSSTGGNGGVGGLGADGQPGGIGGLGGRSTDPREPPSGAGFAGGAGGAGGRGGNGGSGGGGPSIGIVYVGTKPATESVVFNLGTPGKGGPSSGSEKTANGQSGDMVAVTE